jgi:hypothetical protein
MFRRHTAAEKNALMREYWRRTKQQGKARFIRRQMLASLLFCMILLPASDLFESRPHATVQTTVLIDLIMLPIFLLGGYLEGRWKWTDLEKKYPEDSLPPWE